MNNNGRAFKRTTKPQWPPRPAKKPNNHPKGQPSSVVLDPKMLNISAGGHFYERAKSRRNRHREVYASTAEGQAVAQEAVPLGLKRKYSGELSIAAKERLKRGREVMRKEHVGKARDSIPLKNGDTSCAHVAPSNLVRANSTLMNKKMKLGEGEVRRGHMTEAAGKKRASNVIILD